MTFAIHRALVAALIVTGAAAAQDQDLYDDSQLRTLELTFHQPDWWTQLENNKQSETYIEADLRVGNTFLPRVGVRFRGGATYSAAKRKGKKVPFKISFGEFLSGQRLFGYRSIDLSNSQPDPTWMREALAFKVLRELHPASRTAWVKLVINKESWGPYLNIEPVNKDFLARWFRDTDGNRYKGAPLNYRGSDPALYKPSFPLLSKERPDSWKDLIQPAWLRDKASVQQREAELPKVFDVDLLLRHFAGNVVLGNSDGYPRHNFYIYSDPWHERLAILPWDLNLSQLSPLAWVSAQDSVMQVHDWGLRFLGYTRNLFEEVYDWQKLSPWIMRSVQLIDAEVKADTKSLWTYEEFRKNLTDPVQAGLTQIAGLKQYVEQRRANFLGRADFQVARPKLELFAQTPQNPGVGNTVDLVVRVSGAKPTAVTLHWRSRGYFQKTQMFDDGLHADGQANDGLFGAAIPPQPAGSHVEYWFSATSAGVGATIGILPFSGPHRAFHYELPPSYDSVLLNEFVARNKAGAVDEKGEHEDWIELINPLSVTVSLDGMYLTDHLAQPTKWKLPAGTKLAPGQTLLVWADGEPGDGPLHATFGLDGDGEEIALYAKNGITLLDHVRFGPQQRDIAGGRLFAAPGPWVSLMQPTPGRANAPASCGFRSYSALEPSRHDVLLAGSGEPKLGNTPVLSVTSAPSGGAMAFVFGPAPAAIRIADIDLLTWPPALLVPVVADASGAASLPLAIPNDQKLAGARLYVQVAALSAQGLRASNALEIGVCSR